MRDHIRHKKNKIWRRVIILFILGIALMGSSTVRWLNWRNELPPLNIPFKLTPKPNAYDIFLSASNDISDSKLIEYALNTHHRALDPDDRIYSWDEKKRFVDENTTVLKRIKSGFQYPYMAPVDRWFKNDYPDLDQFITIMRLLLLQSEVYQHENKWVEAAQCRLDVFEMGTTCSEGAALAPYQFGDVMGTAGSWHFRQIWKHLNLAEIKEITHRYEMLMMKRQPIWKNIEEEKWSNLAILYSVPLGGNRIVDYIADHTTIPKRSNFKQITRYGILAYGKRAVVQNIAHYYDECILFAGKPYKPHAIFPAVPADPLSQAICPDVGKYKFVEASIETEERMQLTLLALNAYKLEHGRYPKSLFQLTPKYISEVPLDPFDFPNPLQYTLNGSNYLLYSIGPDGKDDGGIPLQDLAATNSPNSKSTKRTIEATDAGDIVAGINDWE